MTINFNTGDYVYGYDKDVHIFGLGLNIARIGRVCWEKNGYVEVVIIDHDDDTLNGDSFFLTPGEATFFFKKYKEVFTRNNRLVCVKGE